MTRTADVLQGYELRIAKDFPAAKTEVHRFDSGACVMDIRLADKMFVVECYPDGPISVYRMEDAEPFTAGPSPVFNTKESAARRLIRLLKDAEEEARGTVAA